MLAEGESAMLRVVREGPWVIDPQRTMIAAAERGEGLAGKLFADEELAQNIVTLSSNLNEVSVKLNRRGLWSVLWEDKTKKKEEAEKARKEKNR